MDRIKYIWHDCFVVMMPQANFIFDYWKDPATPEAGRGHIPGFLSRLRRDVPTFVLVSHGHKDHYNPDIFSFAEVIPDIRYIVSNDVYRRTCHITSPTSLYAGTKISSDRLIRLRNGEEYAAGDIRISACPSTDIGNSYVIHCGERVIFHAGDLNAWVWKDESTEQEIRKASGDYEACLRDVEKVAHRFDYAFFPVDSRLGRDYWEGAARFVRRFRVAHFFPMHFGLGDAEEQARYQRDALRFDLYANPERGEYIPLAIPCTEFFA